MLLWAKLLILWVESQNSAVIALLVFGICYMLAVIIFIAVVMVSRWGIAAELKATTPTMLTPLGVIAGLLIAFLASRVWTNFDHAKSLVAREATAIREAVVLSDAFRADERTKMRNAIKKYLQFVETEDWPAMTHGHASLRQLPSGLTDAMTALLSFAPAEPGQRIAQQRAVVAIEQALQARRDRILLSETFIAPIQWLVILILDVLILLTIGMVHIDRRVAAAVNLFTFSTAVAVCLVLLMVSDRPFSSGGITAQPDALREIGLD